MRRLISNEARSAKLAITSLISNKREWNNCLVFFFFFFFFDSIIVKKFERMKYERKKRENPGEIEKKNLMKMRVV